MSGRLGEMQGTTNASRDPRYYLSDGNAILQVEATLFKVHKSVVIKDGSIFENLFSLPALDVTATPEDGSDSGTPNSMIQEGDSDENPIWMRGDTADELRALLWALYALYVALAVLLQLNGEQHLQLTHHFTSPAEIAAAMINPDIIGFVNLTRMAHKYHFSSTERWALQTLTSCMENEGYHIPIATLKDVTAAAVLCDDAGLLEMTKQQWRRLIGEGTNISTAILTAEQLNLRDILGLAYHAMMLQGREVWDADPLLSRSHRVRLLSGHYTLFKLSESLPENPPDFVHDPICSREDLCTDKWRDFWAKIHADRSSGMIRQIQGLAVRSADYLGKYMLAESIVKAAADHRLLLSGFAMNQRCVDSALQATQRKVKEIRRDFADHFVDVD